MGITIYSGLDPAGLCEMADSSTTARARRACPVPAKSGQELCDHTSGRWERVPQGLAEDGFPRTTGLGNVKMA